MAKDNEDIWWEDEDVDPDQYFQAFVPDIPPGEPLSATTVWGDVGTIGIPRTITKDELESLLGIVLKSLAELRNIDEWISALRHADAEPNIYVYKHVRLSENILFEHSYDADIKDQYFASPISALHFQMMRAYSRADEGEFQLASGLWEDISENKISTVDDYKKTFVLTNLYLACLCNKEWGTAMEHLNRLWNLVKFMDGDKRHAFGVWDEWMTCLVVSWYFMKHSSEFSGFFRSEYAKQSDPFLFQRKSILMDHLSPNFVVKSVRPIYYDRARTFMPELPEIEETNAYI